MSRKVYAEDHISKIDTFLCKAYNATKGGYVKTSMIALAKAAKVVRPSETLAAARNLGIIKQQGQRRGAMYHWPGNPPDIGMAEKVFKEIQRIDVNKNLEKTAKKNAKSKNLVPIVGSARPGKLKKQSDNVLTKSRAIEILDDMIKNIGTLFMIPTVSTEYGVRESFFQPLIELDIIQAYNRIPGGFYKLVEVQPKNKDVIIDMILEAYNEKPPSIREKSADERSEQVFDFLKFIDRNPQKGSMVTMMKDRGLAAIYQTIAIRLGHIVNTGTNNKPVYQLVGMPNMSMAQEIVAGVRDYWSKGDQKKEDKKQVIPVMVQPQTTAPSDGDLNSMLDRAIKRKAFLVAEMEKVDKIIDNANAIKKLTAELMNN